MVSDLADMMVERLQEFQKKSKALPQRIIVYRDGVSEVPHPPYHLSFRSPTVFIGTIPHCRARGNASDQTGVHEVHGLQQAIHPEAYDRHLR